MARAAQRTDPVLPVDLVATLVPPEGGRYSELERLRRPPTRTTGTAFARSLERVDEIGAFQLGRLKLSQIPPNRLASLARYGLGSKAASLERAAEPKRTAMLTAVMRHLKAKAIDEALDLFSVLMATRMISRAKRATDEERLSTLPQLEKASRTLARAAKVLFEELELVEAHGTDLDAAALCRAVEEVAPRAVVMSAARAGGFARAGGRTLTDASLCHRSLITPGQPRRGGIRRRSVELRNERRGETCMLAARTNVGLRS